MSGEPREVLVVHDPGADVLPTGGRVVQRMPPRLTIVTVPADAVGELGRQHGVRGVFDGDVPTGQLSELDESERLFAQAWGARQHDKERLGEGLPWDAPGFKAP